LLVIIYNYANDARTNERQLQILLCLLVNDYFTTLNKDLLWWYYTE